MKGIRTPEYITKEQLVRGTLEARRLDFDAFTNEFLCSLNEPRYRVYAAWLHTNGDGFSDVVRIQFFLDSSRKQIELFDVSHDLYAEMLSNPIDRAAEKLLANMVYEVLLPAPATANGFTLKVRKYADDRTVDDIVRRIIDYRLPGMRRALGDISRIRELSPDETNVDYVAFRQNQDWVIFQSNRGG